MRHAEETACRDELRRSGLPAQHDLARLLMLLRAAPETHIGLSQVVRLAAEVGLAATRQGLARQLQTLADHGLLGQLPTTAGEPVFDTVPELHHHLVYETTAQMVDLQVAPETLLAILRQALNEGLGAVDVLIRVRAGPALTTDGDAPGGRVADENTALDGHERLAPPLV
jgi:Fe2+ or Zn2+ uptake regulation protein